MEKMTVNQRDTVNGIRYIYFLNVGHYRRLEGSGTYIPQEAYVDLSNLYNLMIDLIASPDIHGSNNLQKGIDYENIEQRETE